MNRRADLIDRVRIALAKGGFAVSERCEIRPISFDVVARRDNRLLILKVLGNVDAFTERVANELATLARFLQGAPLLIGERSGAGDLEDGVAYLHRGIPAMTIASLEELILEDSPPIAYSTPGGLNVRLDGEMLRRLRVERSLSLGMLAQIAGVSRRAIQMYEEGMRATIEAALRLEDFLKHRLIEPADPFQMFTPSDEEPAAPAKVPGHGLEEEVFRLLRSVGYEVVPTRQSPFEALTRRDPGTILTGVEANPDGKTRRRAQLISSIAQVTEKDHMIVVRHEMRLTDIQGTPVVQRRELEKVRDPQELADLLADRKKRRKAP